MSSDPLTKTEQVMVASLLELCDSKLAFDSCTEQPLDDTPDNREFVLAVNREYAKTCDDPAYDPEKIHADGGQIGTDIGIICDYVKKRYRAAHGIAEDDLINCE